MTIYKLTMAIGHNVENQPELHHAEVLHTIEQYLKPEGYTAYEASGMYKGEREGSTVVVIDYLPYEELSRMCSLIPVVAHMLGQKEISVERTESISYGVKACDASEMYDLLTA